MVVGYAVPYLFGGSLDLFYKPFLVEREEGSVLDQECAVDYYVGYIASGCCVDDVLDGVSAWDVVDGLHVDDGYVGEGSLG